MKVWAASERARVASALGRVNLFSELVGPTNLVKPLPVPPKGDPMTPPKSAVPSNCDPYIHLGDSKLVAVPALPVVF